MHIANGVQCTVSTLRIADGVQSTVYGALMPVADPEYLDTTRASGFLVVIWPAFREERRNNVVY